MDIYKKFKAISEISESLLASRDFKTIGERIFETLERYDNKFESGGKLGVYDKRLDLYEVVYYKHNNDYPIDFKIKCTIKDVKLFSRLAIERNEIILINNSHSIEALRIDPELKNQRIRTMIFIPLLCNGDLQGLFSYARYGKNAIDKKLLDFLKTLANFSCLAIQNLLNKKYEYKHENNFGGKMDSHGNICCNNHVVLTKFIKMIYIKHRDSKMTINNIILKLGYKYNNVNTLCQKEFKESPKSVFDIVKLSFVIDLIFLRKNYIWRKLGFSSHNVLLRLMKSRTGKTLEDIKIMLEDKTIAEKNSIKKRLLNFDVSLLVGYLKNNI